MKVLLVSSNSSSGGGGEQYLVYLARGLRGAGVDVHVLLSDAGYMDVWEAKFRAVGVKTHRKPLKGLRNRPLRFFQSASDRTQIKLLRKIYEEIGPDVIHVNQQYDADGLDYLAGAMCFTHAKIIGTIHLSMTFTKHPRGASGRTFLINLLRVDHLKKKFLFKWYSQHKYLKIFPSEAMRDEFLEAYGGAEYAHIVRNGIDISKFHDPSIPRNNVSIKTMGFAGRLELQKDPFLLIDVWQRVRKIIRCRLCLIGDGTLRGKLESKLRTIAPESEWEISGWVPDPEKYLKKIDLFLLTSNFETEIPLAVREAVCMGIPSVCVDSPGIKENAGEIPYLDVVDTRDPGRICDIVIGSLQRQLPTLREVEEVRRCLSAERMAAETFKVYKSGVCP